MLVGHRELVGVREDSPAPPWPTTPAASPSSPSTKFTALTRTTVTKTVSGTAVSAVSESVFAVGQQREGQLHAEQHHHAGAGDLTGELRQRVERPPVVDRAEQADQAHRRSARPAARRSHATTADRNGSWRRQHARRRRPAYIAIPPSRGSEWRGRRGRAPPPSPAAHRKPPRQRGDQERHRCRDEEHEGVLTHVIDPQSPATGIPARRAQGRG